MGEKSQIKAMLWKNQILLLRPRKWPIIGFCVLVGIIYGFRSTRIGTPKAETPAIIYGPHYMDTFVSSRIVIPYTPLNEATQKLMDKASEYCKRVSVLCSSQGFITVKDAFKSLLERPDPITDTPVLQFEFIDDYLDVPNNLRFKVLVPYKIITTEPFGGKDSSSTIYGETNIIQVMLLVTTCFIMYWSGDDNHHFRLGTVFMPQLPVTENTINRLRDRVPLTALGVLIVAGTIIIKLVGEEKENKLKESMKLMGLSSGLYWFAWTITGFIYFQLPILCLLASLFYPTEYDMILEVTDQNLFYTFMTLATFNTLSFLFVVTCLFNSSKTSLVAFPVLCLVLQFLVTSLEQYLKSRVLIFIIRSFIPTAAFTASAVSFIDGEKTGNGYSFLNLHQTPGVNYQGTLLEGLIALIVNTLFHLFLLWYMDNVFPGEFGVSESYDFCCTKRYWLSEEEDIVLEIPPVAHYEKNYEPPPQGLHIGIQLRGLVKVYGTKVAVAGTNFDIYETQITVLLGHNGSGKTTIMAMIAGLLQPTEGTVMVNGFDMFAKPSAARSGFGLCPQHDTLYDQLTCAEHIKFYCWLMGATTTDLQINMLLNEAGLLQEKSTYARSLSESQRRKLSLASAVTGGSRVLVLDEPSVGLDPNGRRQLWDFLKKLKSSRTILVTTHHMDEAEAIGDRIAIMHEGIIKCCGSPMFLKNIYKAGYTLNIVKKVGCNTDILTHFMKTYIPQTVFKGCNNTEIFFHLPETCLPKFGLLLRALEREENNLEVESFGLTATSMEEVFFKVGQGVDPECDSIDISDLERSSLAEAENQPLPTQTGNRKEFIHPKEISVDLLNVNENNENTSISSEMVKDLDFMENYTPTSGFKRLWQQMKAIVYKKAILTKRKWLFTFINAIFIPLVMVSMGLHLEQQFLSSKFQPALTYSLKPFEGVTIVAFYGTDNQTIMDFYQELVQPPHEFKIVPTDKFKDLNAYLLEVGRDMGMDAYLHNLIIGAEITVRYTLSLLPNVIGMAYYQTNTHHGIGISTQMILNTFVKIGLGDNYSVETGIASVYQELQIAKEETEPQNYMLPLMIIVSMAILPSVFIHRNIREREIGAYHLQRMCGLHPFTYWLPTYFWDMSVYSVTMIIIFLACITSPELLLLNGKWAITFVVLTSYGLAMLPNCYVLQRVFSTPAGGVSTVMLINIIVGFVCGMTMSFIVETFYESSKKFKTVHLTLAVLNPLYSLTNVIMRFLTLTLNNKSTDLREIMDDRIFKDGIIVMWCLPFGNFLLLFLSEYMIDRKIWYALAKQEYDDIGKMFDIHEAETLGKEDKDVVRENVRIRNTSLEQLVKTDVIILRNLCKIYKGKVAVNRTCVGIPQRECFGLLGYNGAGKTSAFQMLTGDIMASGGDALLLGNSIRGDLKKIHVHMGCCPQFDGLHSYLTGQETLYLYGLLKGVPENYLQGLSEYLHMILNITKYANVQTKNYSNGARKKLSFAICLLGKPELICLDEPTSGLDPVSRRDLWKVFRRIRDSGRTMLLTSHSLEECEALCTKIVIMVAGKFQCLGSLQHLKNKFSQGLMVIMKFKHPDSNKPLNVSKVIKHIQKIFTRTKAVDVEHNYIRIHILQTNLKLSYVFEEMEKTKVLFDLHSYAVIQTTLEQIFLALSSSTVPQARAKKSLWS